MTRRYPTNLQLIRRRAKISQAELAEMLGLNKLYISAWEVGTIAPTPEQEKQIAKILKTPREDLFPGRVEKEEAQCH
jgi:transcriptional regulator with XRE-family HTH domain